MHAVLMDFRCVRHGFSLLGLQTLPLHFVPAASEWGSSLITDSFLYVILQRVENCILKICTFRSMTQQNSHLLLLLLEHG